jgi:DNA polymerase III epsilon subunit
MKGKNSSINSLLNSPLNDVIFTVLDVETTGLEPYLDHWICEIALLKFQGTKELDSYSSLVNPQRPIPRDAVRVHGITDEMVRDAPPFDGIARDFLTFIEGSVLIAHNADFDLAFLAKHLRQVGLPIPHNPVVDTLILARTHFRFPDNSLETIAYCLGIDTQGAHRALKDAIITREVFRYFTTEFRVESLAELMDMQGVHMQLAGMGETTPLITAEDAIRTGQKLFLKYVSSSGEETERVVTPIQIDVRRGTPYLIAFCHLRNQERAFRMDRILLIKKGDGSIFR